MVTLSVSLNGIDAVEFQRVAGTVFSQNATIVVTDKNTLTITDSPARIHCFTELLDALQTEPPKPKVPFATLHGQPEISKFFAQYYDARLFGVPLPEWLTLSIPKDGTRDQSFALLKSALDERLPPPHMEVVPINGESGLPVGVNIIDPRLPAPAATIGSDPAAIPLTDAVTTHIVPLRHMKASQFAQDLNPFSDVKIIADDQSNALTLTGPAARIHRIVNIISTLDHQRGGTSVISYVQCKNLNAGKTAKLLNLLSCGPAENSARGGVTGSLAANLNLRLYADADARTNTVILNGPPSKVDPAKAALLSLDAIPRP